MSTVIKLARACSAAAALALVLAAQASPAAAQQARIPFQAELTPSCSGTFCELRSAPVAANRRLQVEEISCNVSTDSRTAEFGNFVKIVTGGGQLVRRVGVLTGDQFPFVQSRIFNARQPTLIFVNTGQRLQVEVFAFGNVTATAALCSIAGFQSKLN